MNFGKPWVQKKVPTENKDKCEIMIKKGQDGSIKKIVRGNCSKEHLRALSEVSDDVPDDY